MGNVSWKPQLVRESQKLPIYSKNQLLERFFNQFVVYKQIQIYTQPSVLLVEMGNHNETFKIIHLSFRIVISLMLFLGRLVVSNSYYMFLLPSLDF